MHNYTLCVSLRIEKLKYKSMKLKSILLSALSAMFISMGASAQGDYYVKHGADVTVNHAMHYPIMVGVSNVRGDQQKLNGIASAPRCQAYFCLLYTSPSPRD